MSPLFLVACARESPDPGPAPAGSTAPGAVDAAKARTFWANLGFGETELVDRTPADLAAAGMDLGRWALPAARLSLFQSRSPDSADVWVRYEGVAPDTDLVAFVGGLTGGGADWSAPARTDALPRLWGGRHRSEAAPRWWDAPSGAGTLVVAISPAEWTDCYYPRGKGVAALQVGDRVYLQSFDHQHYYPTGMCGG